jgi:putative transposase
MPRSYARLFYHVVWATWEREPLIQGAVERHAYALIRSQCDHLRATVHAMGGVEDHVHLLVTIPRTLAVADFMEAVKGVSSRALNETRPGGDPFRWQGGYGVLTVSTRDVKRVARYVDNQREHHASGRLWANCERWDEDE